MDEKRHFLSYQKHRHDAQITWPYAYYVTQGSCCKMANSSSEDKTDTLPKRPTGYSHISLSLSGRILKAYQNIVSASKQTPCGIPWGLQNRTHWSARYTDGRDAVQQEGQLIWIVTLYKFNPLSPHCGSIALELVHCYTWGGLQIVTVHSNTAGWHS